jgi:uncharacterized Zn finger protein (UPF0148 family)
MPYEQPIYLSCPHCGVVLRREDAYVDGAVICPECLRDGRKELLEAAYITEPLDPPGAV